MMPMPEPRLKRPKRIELHTDDELDVAIFQAQRHCDEHGIDFYKILHGVDAYMQRRKRRNESAQAKNYVEEEFDPWGNS